MFGSLAAGGYAPQDLPVLVMVLVVFRLNCLLPIRLRFRGAPIQISFRVCGSLDFVVDFGADIPNEPPIERVTVVHLTILIH